MYTIKIKSVANDPRVPITLKDIFRTRLEKRLKSNNIKVQGVSFFQDRTDFWCVYGLRNVNGSKLAVDDWGKVNDSINIILDELEVNAFVNTDRYTLRKGMEHVTYQGGE
jgi:hypothetical protein